MTEVLREEPEIDYILEKDLDLSEHIIGLQYVDGSRGFVQKIDQYGSCIAARVGKYGVSSSPIVGANPQDLLKKIRKGNFKDDEEQYSVEVFVFFTVTEALNWLLEAERPSHKLKFRHGNY